MDSRQQEQHPPATGDDESYISAPSESTENVAEPSTSTAVAPSLGPVGLGPDDDARSEYSIGADSGLGDEDGAESTASITSSILAYEYENGRRYHAYRSGSYPLPNDEKEQDRMDMQHHIYLMILGGEIYRAPISSKCDRVLDIGTGTGIWAIDFADEHPDSQVIATDLSVIQPQWVPPNLSFQVDDCEADWSYSQPFDFIHIRSMSGSISDWPRTLQQSFQNTVSGGWIELVDFEVWASTDDNSLPENSSYHEYQVRLDEAARRFGKIMNISPQFNSMVNAAGFQDVHEDIYKVPLTPWPADPKQKLLGQYMHLQMTESIEAFCLALFSRVLGWDNNRIQVLLAGVRADLRNKNMHMYSKVHVVYGRKP
ncbi:hypothetical protein MMC28_004372 [Mycoblastus sanguinarius]|nr:hypothetical protein [Mycoblastus sanguinarius]